MSAYKDKKTGNWVVTLRYTDNNGVVKRRAKRGFRTKREAVAWENNFLANISNNKHDIDMELNDFFEMYMNEISNKIRKTTQRNKILLYDKFIREDLGHLNLNKIEVSHILKWQNKILGIGYAETYARSINNQLVAILNHAEKYYNFESNPTKKVTAMGAKEANTMQFWTKEEFDQFIKHVDDESAYIHFNVLFYTGIRIGELIAIKLKDIDFNRGHIDINESAQYIKSRYIFSPPKTKKSERTVTIPQFLVDMIRSYINRYYTIDPNEQVFMTNKGRLAYELRDYANKANVKRIRIHDLRHSHASLLIEQGIQPNIVQHRLGHEKIETTLNTYSHLYPNKQYHLADFLDELVTSTESSLIGVTSHEPLMIQTIK